MKKRQNDFGWNAVLDIAEIFSLNEIAQVHEWTRAWEKIESAARLCVIDEGTANWGNMSFDPTYGYDLQALLAIPAPLPPDDFSTFWHETYKVWRQIPLQLTKREIESLDPAYQVFEVEYQSLANFKVGGWLVVPREGFERLAVVGHGYGGREQPDYATAGSPAASLFPCLRGFGRSRHAEIPDNSYGHVLHGIESRETYVIRGCVADVWGAASALTELFPEMAHRVHFQGGSFCGGVGALALAWDQRFSRAFLDVPTFSIQDKRVEWESVGSGAAVREAYGHNPAILEVLHYFDAASAASYIKAPTFVAAALSDPAVPPPGQFAVYNALGAAKELFVRQEGHGDVNLEEEQVLSEKLLQWFRVD